MWRPYFVQLMNEAFESARSRNKAFSLRSFARVLGVSPGFLSEILRNKRDIRPERAVEVAERAKVPEQALRRLRVLALDEPGDDHHYVLTGKDVQLLTDPVYYRVLSAFEVLPHPCTQADILKLLGGDGERLTKTIELLCRLELIEQEGEKLFWLGRNVKTTEDIASEQIRAFHRETIGGVIDSLSLPVEEREITTVIFAGSEGLMPAAKKDIRKFRELLVENMEGQRSDRVYQLSIQLVPVSKRWEGAPS